MFCLCKPEVLAMTTAITIFNLPIFWYILFLTNTWCVGSWNDEKGMLTLPTCSTIIPHVVLNPLQFIQNLPKATTQNYSKHNSQCHIITEPLSLRMKQGIIQTHTLHDIHHDNIYLFWIWLRVLACKNTISSNNLSLMLFYFCVNNAHFFQHMEWQNNI